MGRILACFLFSVFLVGAVWSAPQVLAQQVEAEQKQKETEFTRRWERLQKATDAEERIALAEQALKIERELRHWPLAFAREEARATLWWHLGLSYVASLRGVKAENLERAIAAYKQALQFFTHKRSPLTWASIQAQVAIAYQQRIRGDRADNLEQAIVSYQAALGVLRKTMPRDWAGVNYNLAAAYGDRIRGDRRDNLEKAIAGYEAALTVFTKAALPFEWARVQNGLANAYEIRISGDRADNMERAIAAHEAALTVRTREALPRDWAETQHNLGNAYQRRIRGDVTDNMERAIVFYEAALTVRTRQALPRDWADTQHNLGSAYQRRIRGDRADNLERAIAALEAALTVRTREALPRQWALTQNNLAAAYASRIRGDRADNMERAIAAHEAALTVRTREALPRDWADTQNNLAHSYWSRLLGDRADNVERAIAGYEAALTVFTREALPSDWATTQNNLAIAFQGRKRGDRADNLERAIAAYEMALTVFTRESQPREWAEKQHNLANAYRDRIRGEQDANLKKAIAGYKAALTVFTREALPRHHLRTGRILSAALLEAKDWHNAHLAYSTTRDAFLLLLGKTLNEAEASDLIREAGPLFAEAAFVAVHMGENARALALANEGRARLMALVLRLGTDERPRVAELRASIRAGERTVEVTQAVERAAAIEKLTSLRQELLGLVKEAAEAEIGPRAALAQAQAVIATGGAVVVPIITKDGGKILIVTNGARGSATSGYSDKSDSEGPLRSVFALDLPELRAEQVEVLLRGRNESEMGGWLGAYNINYLQGTELNLRWSEWLAAVSKLGPELWGLFGARLDAALKQHGIRRGARLIWLPTGALGILPLGLAQDPVTKRRLADDYEIVYALSLDALARAQNQIANTTAATLAVIINPTGDLSGTEKEGKLVASHFPDKQRTVLERSAATPEAVLVALKGKTHWHFASHGTFSWADARQSALILHDQARLSVGRFLESDGLGRPRLVVLSACETGLYDISRNPDEFIGLPGAFTALGAAGVLGTLWPVSDAATTLMIARFYELHMGQGLPPPTALSQAQMWLRQATNADLATYARDAAKQGRLDSHHVGEIEQELSEEGLNRSRNSALVEWLATDGGLDPGKKAGAAKLIARPYAHPYYWAGFIYTGL